MKKLAKWGSFTFLIIFNIFLSLFYLFYSIGFKWRGLEFDFVSSAILSIIGGFLILFILISLGIKAIKYYVLIPLEILLVINLLMVFPIGLNNIILYFAQIALFSIYIVEK
jgi:hypothetical protein